MKIDWVIKISDVIFIIGFIFVGILAIQIDVASHNDAIRKCELFYNNAFRVINITYPVDINPLKPN